APCLNLERISCSVADETLNFELLGGFKELNLLHVRNASFPSLDWLRNLGDLAQLVLRNLGRKADLAPLYDLKACVSIELVGSGEKIEIGKVAQGAARLRTISLKNWEAESTFPNLSSHQWLRKIILGNISGLRDISNLAKLKNLRELYLVDCKDIDDF